MIRTVGRARSSSFAPFVLFHSLAQAERSHIGPDLFHML
jgi:hypothetical protein